MHLTPLEEAASGALASAIANSLVYPLDLSKTLIQTQTVKQVTHTEDLPPTPSSESDNESSGATTTKKKSVIKKQLKYKNTIDVLRQIYKKKGILGWYHGLFSLIFGSAVMNFSYFYWYSLIKKIYHVLNKNTKPNTATQLALGALAAAVSQLFTMPVGVITTQHQTDKHHRGIPALIKEVLEHEGVTGLWKGLRVSLVLCINPSITYGSYERLKQVVFPGKEFLGPLEAFTLGVLAKLLATIATQPLIVSKAMLQKKTNPKPVSMTPSSSVDDPNEKNKLQIPVVTDHDHDHDHDDIKFDHFTECLAYLWRTEKIRGLYKGVVPQLVKGVFVQGLLFMFKDQLDVFFLFLLKLIKAKKV